MNCWIFIDEVTKEEIDREVVDSLTNLDLLTTGDIFICVNNFKYDIVGSYKILHSRKGRVDKFLVCRKHTGDTGTEKD